MTIKFPCPSCGQRISAEAGPSVQSGNCPTCGTPVVIPEIVTEPAIPAVSPPTPQDSPQPAREHSSKPKPREGPLGLGHWFPASEQNPKPKKSDGSWSGCLALLIMIALFGKCSSPTSKQNSNPMPTFHGDEHGNVSKEDARKAIDWLLEEDRRRGK